MKTRKIIITAVFILAAAISYAQPFPPPKDHQLKQLKKALQLNDEQTEKVKLILKDTDARLKELQEKADLEHENEMEQIGKIFTSQNDQIAKILDETQKQKFSKLKEEQEAHMPREGEPPMGGPDGMPPPPPDDGFEGGPFGE